MMSERKRKWILGTLLFVIVASPTTFLTYGLDRIHREIKIAHAAGRNEPWMPVWQCRVAWWYRNTLRNESAAEAFEQYIQLFYVADRDGTSEEGIARAREAVWDYAQTLEEMQKRKEAYPYYVEIIESWPDHPHYTQATIREHELRKMGYGGN